MARNYGNKGNIQETIDSFACGLYYRLFKRYVFILLTKMWTETKTVPLTWNIFNVSRSHHITLPLSLLSFQITDSNKHANDGIWIRPCQNINESTRSLSPGKIKMFVAIHEHHKQYLIENFSTYSRCEGTITIIMLQCTELHFLLNNHPPFPQHEKHIYDR